MNTKKDIEKIYDIIKEKIITMEYKPGVALPEQATAAYEVWTIICFTANKSLS